MTQYIDKSAVVAEIESKIDVLERNSGMTGVFGDSQMAVYERLLSFLDTLEVKEVDVHCISENIATAHEYLSYTHTSNLAHNKPMISARLIKAMKELYNAGLFKLTHDEEYRMKSIGLKVKGE